MMKILHYYVNANDNEEGGCTVCQPRKVLSSNDWKCSIWTPTHPYNKMFMLDLSTCNKYNVPRFALES